MGKKKYYRYNPNTLQYEEIREHWSKKVLRYSLISSAAAFYSFGIWSLATPESIQNLYQEKFALGKKINESSIQLDKMGSSLSFLKEKDNNIYRTSLEMQEIDENQWKAGRGGSVKNADLKNLSYGKGLLSISSKMHQVKHQLTLLAQSQDEILDKASAEERRMRARPIISPLAVLERPIHLSSGFGMRRDPVNKSRWQMHPGIDLGAPMGTHIYCTADGVVVRVEKKLSGYGFNVVVDHGYGIQTLYAHMSKIDAKVGQKVKRGELLGRVGSTGYSTCPHLHYEVFVNDDRVDPAPYINMMTPEEYKEMIAAANPSLAIKAPKKSK